VGEIKESSVTSTSLYPAVMLRLSHWARVQKLWGKEEIDIWGGGWISECNEMDLR